MNHPEVALLVQSFALTHRIIHMQTDELSHVQSILQAQFRGNCLNRVLGPILVGRNQVLDLLGQPSLLDAEDSARYETGSEPITREEQALPLSFLLEYLDESQQRIAVALEHASMDKLNRVVEFRGDRPARCHKPSLA